MPTKREKQLLKQIESLQKQLLAERKKSKKIPKIDNDKRLAIQQKRKELRENNDLEKDFYLQPLFEENIFNSYEDENYTNVINRAFELIDLGYVVSFKGQILKPDGTVLEQIATFYNRDQLHFYWEKTTETSDTEDWVYSGTLITENLNKKIMNKRRSRVGMGTNCLYKINEYIGRYCYIPTDGRCFLKCYIMWKQFHLNRILSPQEQEICSNNFNNFLFNHNRKDRKGIMTNARFGEFNRLYDENLTYYNENDRHIYPKDIYPHDWCYYNYFPPNSSIGHYCLIFIR